MVSDKKSINKNYVTGGPLKRLGLIGSSKDDWGIKENFNLLNIIKFLNIRELETSILGVK
tara:strand:+ start:66 stop:245 length:180 start_codon:yes stop_codon:yes gene_type:complete